MSSILKALKKLEQEKTLRREEEIDLSREILYETPRRRAQVSWPWAAALATIILLVATVALLLNRSATVPATPLQTPQTLTTPAAPAPPVSAPAQTTGTPPAQTAPRPAIIVSRQPALAAAPARKPLQASLPPLQETLPATESRPAPIPASTPAAAVITKTAGPARKQPVPAVETAEPALSVSGIAWNKDSSDRLAIINGQPLTTGSAVNGAVVEEILPDRVRFSHNSRTFEVFIGKSATSH